MGYCLLVATSSYKTAVFVLVNLLLILNGENRFVTPVRAESRVHIVYMGERQHDDHNLITKAHHDLLASIIGSKEGAIDSMVYSYRHGFSGFAAKLTEFQVRQISELPGVVHVIPNRFYSLQTTRTWDYLDLSFQYPSNLLNETNMGDGIIIGLLDTGVWPESLMFNDEGLGPIPSRWKGNCQSGQQFNGTTDCNMKLIGAKYFIDGVLAENDQPFNTTSIPDYVSPRDGSGHGTHTSTIAAGSFVANASYKGLALGTVRGGAPRARIAMYKVCWNVSQLQCSSADILKAFDEAIHDGVDLLSVSLGPEQFPLFAEVDERDGLSIGSFHAVAKGIPVIFAAGNGGPAAQTVVNTAPWILNVAATTLDRSFPTPIILGNNITILGQGWYTGKEIVNGKVVLCFTMLTNINALTLTSAVTSAASAVRAAGGVGLIVAKNPSDIMVPSGDDFPCLMVDYELGTQILLYIRSARSHQVKISPSKTLVGKPASTKVATFSSRGPSSITPAILKPDIAAPGVSILAASSPQDPATDGGFALYSGTSMAAPVISGIVALLKSLHPNWSPAAIRSAIVTTAWKTDPFGQPIFAEGSPKKLANPFDFGGGLVNPNRAAKPGLVYDMDTDDYVHYLCAMPVGYNESAISQLVGRPISCPSPKPSVLDVNVPSITIPNLRDTVTLTRRVTNVGPPNSIYRAMVESPFGIAITVTPDTLVFNSTAQEISFQVRLTTSHQVNSGYYFGSLTWTDGAHNVTIPISVHIVYMGERQHDDPNLITKAHHDLLASIIGSKEGAIDSMVYSYRHGFSGFAAKLTEFQARQISELPGVVHVIPNRFHSLQTTRTWDYLDLSSQFSSNLLNDTNMGDGIIIGLMDTGVWPESVIFNDEGLGPIPSRWKGHCQSGQLFNGTTDCNRKLIGAKYFIDGFLSENDQPFNTTSAPDYMSPRDSFGHGTHTSTIAAGSFVANASYKGLALGTVRGGAPRARIAMYKVCWNVPQGQCSSADILKAFDEAIHDGVDLLSLSLGTQIPLFAEVDERDGIAIGSFHAVAKGIPVICAAANDGPAAQTVHNTAPWILTVAATTLDRSFPTPIILGNNITILGQGWYAGKEIGYTDLVYPERPGLRPHLAGVCESLSFNYTSVNGKVVLCFTTVARRSAVTSAASAVRAAGGVGLIVAKNPSDVMGPCGDDFPCLVVDYELGTQILLYIRSARSPQVKISPSKTLVGKPASTKVATFSSRGPSSITPAILKPDIAAPGVSLLAASSPQDPFMDGGFALHSGTSMATPVISGIVALLKSQHPNWSPAAIRSAMVTTAWKTDPFGQPIFAEGSPKKLANPFDFGGGLVNPNRATKPGLVYDMDTDDYVHYLFAVPVSYNYNESSISQLVGRAISCPSPKPSVLDVNVPSITVPNLRDSVTLTRKVTNVGPPNSIYKPMVEPPFGIAITVTPDALVFNSTAQEISFQVELTTSHQVNSGYYFGSLTWTDGVHNVTIPISVHIVYMGEKVHEDPAATKMSHHKMLSTLLGSKEAAKNSMLYSYKHGFSGFAARLTESQAEEIAAFPGVVQVIPNRIHKLHTTRSWEFMGLNYHSSKNLLTQSNMGEGTIIGVIDSGVWPESESFNDKGMGPIPSRWKGKCQEGQLFNSSNCNNKLIGARWFIKGILDHPQTPINVSNGEEFLSARDNSGHGTHTASTAAGNFVEHVSFEGLASGLARGGAPRAYVAVYKACWEFEHGGCSDADLLKAFDKAIHDGVDILSVSIGNSIPLFSYVDQRNSIAIGSFHATAKGITVACSAGNDGPTAMTVENTAPWIITVAATTIDRAFPTAITLGNNLTLWGQSVDTKLHSHGFTGITYSDRIAANSSDNSAEACLPGSLNATLAAGKIILCFGQSETQNIFSAAISVVEAGGIGLIFAQRNSDGLDSCNFIPCIKVDYEVGTQILSYIRRARSPIAKLSIPKTIIGKWAFPPRVADFSARGPSSISPAVLKPDIAAPGVDILAAYIPVGKQKSSGFRFLSGTSMSCPHVAGIAALIKSVHTSWSPAAIRSALVTTASQTGTDGSDIAEEGSTRKPANPFDIGSGLVNPNRAIDPGLVYDAGIEDYILFLCGCGYSSRSVTGLTKAQINCTKTRLNVLNLNLPSITIPNLKKKVTVTRIVTNVGAIDSVYKGQVQAPHGIKMKVEPQILRFNKTTQILPFKVTFISTLKVHGGDYRFGSLIWTDGRHVVRSPISVRAIWFGSYTN
ncbi:hypothetical protein COLO4_10836 [Corchorus olitorius]|uniref:Peptidase S8/S53 domain-containing protein n=1 Tax=Corchorus olitorius TaxID=93759 RepID=A0A1R3K6R4_9ROSI|nr:hypothetical protein COLO4_10836 [Corchorus olitorius]